MMKDNEFSAGFSPVPNQQRRTPSLATPSCGLTGKIRVRTEEWTSAMKRGVLNNLSQLCFSMTWGLNFPLQQARWSQLQLTNLRRESESCLSIIVVAEYAEWRLVGYNLLIYKRTFQVKKMNDNEITRLWGSQGRLILLNVLLDNVFRKTITWVSRSWVHSTSSMKAASKTAW